MVTVNKLLHVLDYFWKGVKFYFHLLLIIL